MIPISRFLEVSRVRFDAKQLKRCFEKNDIEELKTLGHHYLTNTTYIEKKEYMELEELINVTLDWIYNVENRDVQQAFFDMIKNVINVHYRREFRMQKCLNKIEQVVINGKVDDWELAETLLIISYTIDERYMDLMSEFKDHEDVYIREIVSEYIYDIEMQKLLKKENK